MAERAYRATVAVVALQAVAAATVAHAATVQPAAFQTAAFQATPIQTGALQAVAAQGGAPPQGWSGRGEAGMVLSQGNAESSTASLKLGLVNQREHWRHSLQLAALRATNKGRESAARIVADGQSDLQIRRHAFWFGGLRYESDRFSGFHYQESASTGAGYRFRDTELLKLSAQVGAGYRRLSDRNTDQIYIDTVAVAGIYFDHRLGQNTRLVDRAHAESGRYNTLASNYTGVEVKMNAKLGLSAGYDLRHNSEPPPGLRPDDAVSTVHLVYAF